MRWNFPPFFFIIFMMKKFIYLYQWWQLLIIVLSVAINVFIIVNSCMNAHQSSHESGFIVDLLSNILNGIKPGTINEENYSEFSSVIRKLVGHFGLFLISGIFTTLSIKFIYYDLTKKCWIFLIISASSGLFLAILTEIIQLFVPGRSGEFKDVMIDFGGYIIPLIIISAIIFFKGKKTSDIEKEDELV